MAEWVLEVGNIALYKVHRWIGFTLKFSNPASEMARFEARNNASDTSWTRPPQEVPLVN